MPNLSLGKQVKTKFHTGKSFQECNSPEKKKSIYNQTNFILDLTVLNMMLYKTIAPSFGNTFQLQQHFTADSLQS